MRLTALLLSSFVASHTSALVKKISIISCLLFSFHFSFAQDSLQNLHANQKQIWVAGTGTAVFFSGSYIVLNQAWYKDYVKTSFHTFNDSREWLQVDKIGHGWSAYNLAKTSTAIWDWTGVSHNKALLIGGLSGMGYLVAIEFLDAHSAKWGWSWSDMGANLLGSGLFISQELLWNGQRIQYKFSSHKKKYNASLKERADDLYGDNLPERIFKDYNAQAYWLSANLKSFLPRTNLPAWLNVAAGYGADGLFGGFENKWIGRDGNTIVRNDIARVRQFYLSPDVDFTKIKTNKKSIKALLTVLNVFKMPAPALMINSKGKLKAYAIYF